MTIVKDIRKRLKFFLESEQLTQYAFAKKSGVSQSTIKRFLEDDIKNPSSDLLEAIARGMDGKIKFIKE